VLQVEAGRRLQVRFGHGHRSDQGLVDGHPPVALMQRVVDVNQRPAEAPSDGLLMTDRLAEKLHLQPGDLVTLEIREGRRELLQVPLRATVSDMMGLNAFIQRDALNRLLGDGDVANFFSLRVGAADLPRVLELTQGLPGWPASSASRRCCATWRRSAPATCGS
jgi:putative ABC transport system permease protein